MTCLFLGGMSIFNFSLLIFFHIWVIMTSHFLAQLNTWMYCPKYCSNTLWGHKIFFPRVQTEWSDPPLSNVSPFVSGAGPSGEYVGIPLISQEVLQLRGNFPNSLLRHQCQQCSWLQEVSASDSFFFSNEPLHGGNPKSFHSKDSHHQERWASQKKGKVY